MVPTGTDVAGTSSILSLILSPSPQLFCPSFFLASTRWRDAPFQTFLVLRSESCDPACYLILLCSLSLSLSLHPKAPMLPHSQCPPPLDKGRQRPFFSPWPACTLCVCTVPNRAPSLIVFLPSFCNRRCLGALGPLPQACEGGPQRRGRVYYFI